MNEDTYTPRDADFWQHQYDEGNVDWDRGAPSPPIVRLLAESPLPDGSKVLVPGCGLGHEVIFVADLGYSVTAVDFAESAVAGVKARAGDLPVTVLHRDIFGLADDHDRRFDVVLEHTCFCAIPVEMRPHYADVMHAVLKPGGRIVGLFFETDEEEGPPFRTTQADIEAHFSSRFDITRMERPADSFEGREGNEWLVEMTKR